MRRLLSLGRAHRIVESLTTDLRASSLPIQQLSPAGALRRADPLVDRMVVVLATSEPDVCIDALPSLSTVQEVLHREAGRFSVMVQDEPVELVVTPPAHFAVALLRETGTTSHLDLLEREARARGFVFRGDAVTSAQGGEPTAETERELYTAVGLQYVPPEIRDGTDEISLAREHALPELIDVPMIRGDLHMHTRWSDGRDEVEAMVLAARALGYEYIAITDHSPSSGAARSLTDRTIREQMKEVARVREAVTGIEILHGAEVDILSDGRLDFPDALLEELDIVLASLHHANGHSGARLTDRYVRAMEHPFVNVITHPSNRLVGRREGYNLDFERLFEAAVRTGTLLEVDGAPIHLDMDGAVARRAVAAGVTLVIDSDCHRAELLGRQMGFGVATARRGRVEPAHVINTQPLVSVQNAIRRKRAAG